jgi:ribosome-binding factor A
MGIRIEKVNKELQRLIMDVISKEIDDPNLGLFSIVKVDTSPDLKESKIYFSLLDDKKYDEALRILDKMGGFIRASVAKKIHLKILPNFKFVPDHSISYSVYMYKKIEEVIEDDRKNYRKNKE